MVYHVTVKESYRWKSAQVAGRIFSKLEPTPIGEAAMVDEILNSPILEVIEVVDELAAEPEEEQLENEVDATNGAVELAADFDIDLANVEGTGANGRITKADVEAYIEAM